MEDLIEINEEQAGFEEYCNIAENYLKKFNRDKAVLYFEKAATFDPENENVNLALGQLFYEKGLFDKALDFALKAYKYLPDDFKLNKLLGTLYRLKKNTEKTILHYEKALNHSPNNFDLLLDLGYVYLFNGDFVKAINYLEKAKNFNRFSIIVTNLLGMCYLNTLNLDKAAECFFKTIELEPNNPTAVYNIGYILILQRDFKNGWAILDEGRINYYNFHALKFPETQKPKWRGESLKDKTIYVYETGGMGDTIQYCRYLPILSEMGAKVICKQRACLDSLLEEADFKVEIIDNSIPDETLEFDYQAQYMTLPASFMADFDNIPYKDGYLKPNAEKVKIFKDKYFDNEYFKVGIIWSGSRGTMTREINLDHFYKIAKIPNLKLYSLQKQPGEADLANLPNDINIENLAHELNNFSDTAAIMKNLDLVISIDSSCLHLAGSIGVPVWGVIPYLPDWRYHLNINHSPWYNSLKLFRQKGYGNWNDPIEQIYGDLLNLI